MCFFIKKIPLKLNILFSLSIIIMTAKIFYFNQFPEIFDGAHETGIMFEGVLTSIIASYIFYLIVVHTKEVKDKKKIDPYVLSWSRIVFQDCNTLVNEITKKQISLENITWDKLIDSMDDIFFKDEAPLILTPDNEHANWVQYLRFTKNRSNNYISKILSCIIYNDSELTSLILDIQGCGYFIHMDIIFNDNKFMQNNYKIHHMYSLFEDYCKKCLRLKQYIESLPHTE